MLPDSRGSHQPFDISPQDALQYPNEISEYGRYYSGYDDKVHRGEHAYTSYSIWDTFRAETAFLTMFAPERIDGMITSMLQVFQQGGWLPMVCTSADNLFLLLLT